MSPSVQPPDNSAGPFGSLPPTVQNEILWRHNRWLLQQLTTTENSMKQLRENDETLRRLAYQHDFYRQFSAELDQLKDRTTRDLRRIKDLYQTNPTIADLAVDELIDAVQEMVKTMRLEARVQFGIPHQTNP
ncbi:hypothetical protein F5984_02765 [Rudanella paleaurantiibacter]|uniref:Uncharacterized protein n=1 Tax=Rudanella paleaurantiibacter TaxID=2614655 RepID=A0A7J5U538_9BACT|nr:hypothetical protein [Rudanella paleaurantiibacter]KAB7732886.1 hypothetical protein F5984_02765 [Rudanella paleaurantiibacter]